VGVAEVNHKFAAALDNVLPDQPGWRLLVHCSGLWNRRECMQRAGSGAFTRLGSCGWDIISSRGSSDVVCWTLFFFCLSHRWNLGLRLSGNDLLQLKVRAKIHFRHKTARTAGGHWTALLEKAQTHEKAAVWPIPHQAGVAKSPRPGQSLIISPLGNILFVVVGGVGLITNQCQASANVIIG